MQLKTTLSAPNARPSRLGVIFFGLVLIAAALTVAALGTLTAGALVVAADGTLVEVTAGMIGAGVSAMSGLLSGAGVTLQSGGLAVSIVGHLVSNHT